MAITTDIGLQGSLFGAGEPAVTSAVPCERVDLALDAWYVRVPGWLAGVARQ